MFPQASLSPPPLFERPHYLNAPSTPSINSPSLSASHTSCGSTPSTARRNEQSGSPATASLSFRSPSLSPPRSAQHTSVEVDHVNANRAANLQDRLPNEIWGEIASFSSHNDILNLRATSNAMKQEADVAITSIRLKGGAKIRAFAEANSFPHTRQVNLYGVDNDSLLILARHLSRSPRENLRVTLMSRQGSISEALGQLARLPLAGLLVSRYHHAEDNGLARLTECQYPVELTGYFTREALISASQIPTLSILYSNALGFDDRVAASYTAHPHLQYLLLYANPGLSSRGVADIAAMPALRDLVLYYADKMVAPLDARAASALAGNGALETVYIHTGLQCLEGPSFYALSDSQTVKTLRIAICEDMHHIGRMRRLCTVMLDGLGADGRPITRATAQAMVSLPDLRFVTLRHARAEPNALNLLLAESAATNVHLHRTPITSDVLSAILSNIRLETLRLDDSEISQEAIGALSQHPTLTNCTVNGVSVDRLNQIPRHTTHAQVNHVF